MPGGRTEFQIQAVCLQIVFCLGSRALCCPTLASALSHIFSIVFCPMTDFLIVNSKVTSDYDLAEGQILYHLSEVLTGKDFVASF